eukprot:8525929-Pyramimonas_sp.AAC.1
MDLSQSGYRLAIRTLSSLRKSNINGLLLQVGIQKRRLDVEVGDLLEVEVRGDEVSMIRKLVSCVPGAKVSV